MISSAIYIKPQRPGSVDLESARINVEDMPRNYPLVIPNSSYVRRTANGQALLLAHQVMTQTLPEKRCDY